MALFNLTHSLPAASMTGEPSLRADATGNSILFSQGRVLNTAAPETYDLGFTVEYAIQPTAIGQRTVSGGISKIVPGVQSHSNVPESIFGLGFDNWNNPGAGTNLTPSFVILSKNRNYDEIDDVPFIEGEARGTKVLVVNNVYHLLGTLRASDGLCQIYVNGVLEGTAAPNINMASFIDAGFPGTTSLASPTRSLRQHFAVGTRQHDGAIRNVSNSGAARIDNVRWYSTHFSAAQAALAASAIAFTP